MKKTKVVTKSEHIDKLNLKNIFVISSHHIFEMLLSDYEMERAEFNGELDILDLFISGINLPRAIFINSNASLDASNSLQFGIKMQKSMLESMEQNNNEVKTGFFGEKHKLQKNTDNQFYIPDYKIAFTLEEAIRIATNQAGLSLNKKNSIALSQVALLENYSKNKTEENRKKCTEKNMFLIPEKMNVNIEDSLDLKKIYDIGFSHKKIFQLIDPVEVIYNETMADFTNTHASENQIFNENGSYQNDLECRFFTNRHHAIFLNQIYSLSTNNLKDSLSWEYFLSKEEMLNYAHEKMKQKMKIHKENMKKSGFNNKVNHIF